MNDWNIRTVGEVVKFHRGISWSRHQEVDLSYNDAIPVLRIPNIKEKLDTSDLLYLKGVSVFNRDKYAATNGWILMVGSNGNPDRVGDAVHITEDSTFLFASFLVGIEPLFTTEVHPKFLFYILRNESTRKTIQDSLKGSTGLRNLSVQDLLNHKFYCPPIREQKRIAETLESVDGLIENTHSLIAKYLAIKQGIMQDLFTRGVNENGELRLPYDQAPAQYSNVSGIMIPNEWEVSGLKEKARPDRPYLKTGPFGSSLKGEHWVEEGVPVITIGALGEGFIIESELLKINRDYASLLHEYSTAVGDIVFSRVADVGRSVVITEKEAGWIISSNLMRISLDARKADPYYTYLCFAFNEQLRSQIRQSVNSGGREIANSEVLNRLFLLWPPIEEQRRIGSIAQSLYAVINSEISHVRKLQTIKSGLMQDLLTGKVRAKVDASMESTNNVGVHQS